MSESNTTTRLQIGVWRLDGGGTRVQVCPGYAVDQPGVTCVNPEASVSEQVFRKDFINKRVFLADEYDAAMTQYIRGPNVIVVSMNGYSQLTPEWLQKYGVSPGAYEAACTAILERMINHIQVKFAAAQVRVIHGASAMGIDLVIDTVARRTFGLMPLGFSCPEFMIYVPDDDVPVYVAADKPGYANAYIRSLDLLVTTGGRAHALQHDILAACIYDRRVHFVDVPNMLAAVTVPARIMNAKGEPVIENAAAAFGKNITYADRDNLGSHVVEGGDQWDALFANLAGIATEVGRKALPAGQMFQERAK